MTAATTEQEGYAYASCSTCGWKLSRHGDAFDVSVVRITGRDHAEEHGHEVNVTSNERITIDCRVERPA